MAGHDEHIDRRGELIKHLANKIELMGTPISSLLLLGSCRAEDHDLGTHFGCVLDGQMSEPANAEDTDSLLLGDGVGEGGVDSCPGTLEGGGMLACETVGDLVYRDRTVSYPLRDRYLVIHEAGGSWVLIGSNLRSQVSLPM